MKVNELMSRSACSCGMHANLAEAAAQMWQHDCGALPVLDEDGKVMGMVTDRDLAMAVAFGDRRPSDVQVTELAKEGIYFCHADDDIERALEVMAQQQVRRLPVVDGDDRLLGVLALNDVILNAEPRRRKSAVSYADVMPTLQAISEHRHVNVVGQQVDRTEALVGS